MNPREQTGLVGCRRRAPREQRLAAREAARVREHAEAAARLKRKYG
jgi:hypothetical protein